MACDDSASIDCARVMRGTSSIAIAAAPVPASARHAGRVAERVQERDHDLAGAQARALRPSLGAATFARHSAAGEHAGRVRHHLGPCLGVLGVGVVRARPGPGLDEHLVPVGDERRHDLGHERDPALVRAHLA